MDAVRIISRWAVSRYSDHPYGAVLRRIRPILVVLAGAGALLLGSTAPALAQTSIKIGQTGQGQACIGPVAFGDTNYEVQSGTGTITSFSFQSSPTSAGQRLAFLVLRPEGGNNYLVVGTTGLEALKGTGLDETFPADIAVQKGDVLGYWVPGGQRLDNCLRTVATGGGAVLNFAASEPTAGTTLTLFGSPSSDLNVSATLEPSPPPVIATIEPASGPASGGTPVELTGSGFIAGTTVTVGGVSEIPTSIGPDGTSLLFATPAHATGPVDVTVTNGNGTSNPVTFTFVRSTSNKVAVAGADFAMWTLKDVPPAGPFGSLNGVILAAPAVVSVPSSTAGAPGVPIYIATGQDHALWVRSDTQGWQHLTNAPTSCIDNPAGVVVNAHAAGEFLLTVACQGSDHGLWFAQETVSAGVLPSQTLFFTSLQGTLVNGPAVAAISPIGNSVNGELTFFANGTDGHVWTRTITTGWVQTAFRCLGHPAASTVVSGSSETSVFACQGTDNALWTAVNHGQGFGPAESLGGVLVNGPAVASDPEGPVYYVEGQDGAVWALDTTEGTPFTSLGGRVMFGVGAAALLTSSNNP